LIGTLPPGQLRKPIVASLSGRHSRDRLEALQLLRAKLQVATSGVRRPVIVVTSGQQGEGKSFVVASIGLSLALAGKDVICVDADLYRPETHEYLGLPGDRPGFGDLLDHRAELDDVVQYVSLRPVEQGRGTKRPGGSPGASEAGSDSGDDLLGGPSSTWGSLRAVTAGRQDTNSAPFDERRLAELLEELRSSADYVVFDTPPVLLAGDAFPLLAAADSIVVAARKGWTRKGAAEAVRTTLSGLEFDRVSVILTDSDEREAFGYGGRYYNGRPVRSLHEGSGLERHRIPSE
jgi:non-specific protein-tyrosine kinase